MQLSKQAKEFANLILQHYGCPSKSSCQDKKCVQHHEGSLQSAKDKQAELYPAKTGDSGIGPVSVEVGKASSKPSSGPDYSRWEALSKELDSEDKDGQKKEEDPKNQVWGCSQDHRKERDIYERPNSEKMAIAEDFKKQGDTAYKQQKLQEADYCYQKVLETYPVGTLPHLYYSSGR